MPCCTTTVNESGLPLVHVWITDSAQSGGVGAMTQSNTPADNLPGNIKPCKALLDTGANASCITERVAEMMNLTIQGKSSFSSASDSTSANRYRVNIHIPFGGKEVTKESGEIEHKVTVSNWTGVDVLGIPGMDQSFDVILGMDFIRQGSLHVSGEYFTFCT